MQFAPRPGKRMVARTVSMGSPVGGWNARDALSNMEPHDAVTMQNWYPSTSDCFLRKGNYIAAWGMDATVETLMNYVSPTAESMFAVTSAGTIYDVTAGCTAALATIPSGVVATATTESGLTNGRWQYINMQTTGATAFLLAVNGADKLEGYDGTNWYTDGDGTHDITGVDTADCIHINVHKFRVWLTENNTLNAWYLPTSAIQGAATQFPLAGMARRGGYLIGMATWTIDAGYGVDDHAVFITSEGEIIVYHGTDPASADTWELVGVYQIGAPIGRRCFTKWAGDLLIITHDGLVPLSGALQSSRTNPRVSLSDKIQYAMSAAIANYGDNFGWQVIPYHKENQLYVNVPIEVGVSVHQYVMNAITKSWCNFVEWEANCWELFDNFLFYGSITTGTTSGTSKGVVVAAWLGSSDDSLTDPDAVNPTHDGVDITGNLQQAFSYYQGPTQLKRFTMMRPLWSSNVDPVPLFAGLNMDFDTTNPQTTITGPASSSSSDWETSSWETTPWAGGLQIVRSWQGATGLGYCASPHYVVSTQGSELHLMATDVVYEIGGVV